MSAPIWPPGRSAIELATKYPFIYAGVGIHPQETSHTSAQDIRDIAILARHPRVVAIGEIGLDFHRDYSPHEQQIRFLKQQLALAEEVQKPVVIHSRMAEKEMLQILGEWVAKRISQAAPGVIHCFNGTLETANAYLKLGFYISLGAYIGYPSSRALREVIKQLPSDRLMVETDCPYLPPQNRPRPAQRTVLCSGSGQGTGRYQEYEVGRGGEDYQRQRHTVVWVSFNQ